MRRRRGMLAGQGSREPQAPARPTNPPTPRLTHVRAARGRRRQACSPIPRGTAMTELAFEYALQCWGGVAEFRQAAGVDGHLPVRDMHADDGAGADATAVPAP